MQYRESNGALLVYDITDKNSFDRVRNWVKELKKILGEDISLVIAGNKADLERGRVVTNEEAEEFAKTVNAQHFLVSAKLNRNVSELFLHLAKEMIVKMNASGGLAANRAAPRVGGGGLNISPDENPAPSDPPCSC